MFAGGGGGMGVLREAFQVQCCLTSTETLRIIRDGEPRTATSTFKAPELSGKGLCFVSFKDPYPQMNLQLTVPDR